jgi:serine/threonine protein kinase
MKPGNVFVCTYAGEPDFVKVLDFGIAKSTVGGEVALTAAGTLVGTPRYMPPEQIHGATPAPSMDLYAIGMMMAEMLAGVPVLRGTPMEACMAQLANTPIEFPEAARRSALWPIIRRAATKDVAARYSSADQVLADLTQVKPSATPDAAPFAVREEALPSGQVATQVMADPSVLLPETGLASSPVSSGRAATVFAPLEAPAPVLVPFEAVRAPSSVLSPKLPTPPPQSRRGLFVAAFLLVVAALALSSYLGLRLWRHHESSAVPAGR